MTPRTVLVRSALVLLPGLWCTCLEAGTRLAATEVADAQGAWSEIAPPADRSDQAAVYDPVRDRLVVYGGRNSTFLSDLWILPLNAPPAWASPPQAGSWLPACSGHTAIYDPVRNRVLVFGGSNGHALNDVRALSLGTTASWSALVPLGTPPTPRFWHSAIYDPIRDRMVVFGGTDGNRLNDVWALELAGTPAWTRLATVGEAPSPRFGQTVVYDSSRDRMLVFGGVDASGYLNDAWSLSFATGAWDSLAPSGAPPTGRYFHAAIYDPVADGMVVFGGYDGGHRNDLHALSLAEGAAWLPLNATNSLPPGRSGHSAVYDPLRARMVVFGGAAGQGFRNDVWAVALGESPAWTEMVPQGSRPGVRYEHTAIHDPVRDRMVVFGGYSPGFVNDTWTLSFSASSAWSLLAPAGGPPSVRGGHSAIYDPVRDRMLVFGGVDATNARNDVWALSLSGPPVWSLLAPVGAPPVGRFMHSAIYDPVRDRMLVFGGSDAFTGPHNDVWALSLTGTPAWSALVPTGSAPPARYGQTAIYDPVRDRMIVFGGSDYLRLRNDTWALSLGGSPAWNALATSENPANGRYAHTAIYDPVRDRMVVFGGLGGAYLYNVWVLSLAGTESWLDLGPPGRQPVGVAFPSATYDPVRDRMVVFGGYDGSSIRNDVWGLAWGATVSVPAPASAPSRRLELGRPRPNPSRDATVVEFHLGQPARVLLDVFDARGRRIRRILEGLLDAGPYTATWRGDDDRGRMLGSGVFIIRLQAGDRVATCRVVRIR